jgi:hypothetical protein
MRDLAQRTVSRPSPVAARRRVLRRRATLVRPRGRSQVRHRRYG